MSTLNLLYQKHYAINDSIQITIPSVGEIIDYPEDDYYNLVFILTAMPVDMMVTLDDAGIDYTSIDEYKLFLLMFPCLREQDTHLIFGNLNLNGFEPFINTQNKMVVLRDEKNGITIDRNIHGQIAGALRKIHHLEKNHRKPANKEAKEYMLKRAREKTRRNKDRKQESQLESLIIAMVNTEQYKYDFESTRKLSIYQFNESVRQVMKKVDYDNRMHGVYTGTINPKDLSPDDLNWLTHK